MKDHDVYLVLVLGNKPDRDNKTIYKVTLHRDIVSAAGMRMRVNRSLSPCVLDGKTQLLPSTAPIGLDWLLIV